MENVSEGDNIEKEFSASSAHPKSIKTKVLSNLHRKKRKIFGFFIFFVWVVSQQGESRKTIKADSKAITVLWGITPWTRKRLLSSSSYTAHTKNDTTIIYKTIIRFPSPSWVSKKFLFVFLSQQQFLNFHQFLHPRRLEMEKFPFPRSSFRHHGWASKQRKKDRAKKRKKGWRIEFIFIYSSCSTFSSSCAFIYPFMLLRSETINKTNERSEELSRW